MTGDSTAYHSLLECVSNKGYELLVIIKLIAGNRYIYHCLFDI